MKIAVTIFIFIVLLIISSEARADTVYLKNGRELKGIITREYNNRIDLSVGFGTVTIYRAEINRIVRYSDNENREMEKVWSSERLKRDEELKKLQEEASKVPREIAAQRSGDHLLINALLNGKVNAKLMLDTGSSFIVLSPNMAKELGIDMKGVASDKQVILADGKEVSIKPFKLDAVSVNNFEAKDIDAAIIFDADEFKGFDGLLGMSFLKLFKFEINLAKSKLILQKD